MTAPRTLDSEAVSVPVDPLKGGKRIELSEVVVIDEIPAKPNIIPDRGDLQKHDYLRGVDLPRVGAAVTLLIGANSPEALRVEVVRNGSDGCPNAMRTPLGCSLMETAFKTDGELDDSQDDVRLHAMSKEDRRTYTLMKQSVEYINGHYQLPLPWRYDYQILPDNTETAGKRLAGLKRRFQRNPEVHQKYADQMRLTIEKGYAEEVPEDEIDADRRK